MNQKILTSVPLEDNTVGFSKVLNSFQVVPGHTHVQELC